MINANITTRDYLINWYNNNPKEKSVEGKVYFSFMVSHYALELMDMILCMYIEEMELQSLTVEDDSVFERINKLVYFNELYKNINKYALTIKLTKEKYSFQYNELMDILKNYMKKLYFAKNWYEIYQEFYYNLEACLENAKKDKNKRVLEKKGIN